MSGKFLIDTNIVIASFASEEIVNRKLNQIENIFVPSIVVGELYFGAYKSNQIKENVLRIHTFALKNVILNCDQHTAKVFGKIKADMKLKGTPIPENDLWIAAIAKQYDLVLITRDSHFSNVPNLCVENWC